MTSFSKVAENVPVKSLIAFTQTVVGLGAGLLIADKLGRTVRQKTALALFGAGAAAILPVVVRSVNSCLDNPESARRMRKRLESIRRDAGLSDNDAF